MSAQRASTSQSNRPVGVISRSLLAWGFATLATCVATFAVRAPGPVVSEASPTVFSAERALVHIRAIASTPHPMGSAANKVVRKYLVDQLSTLGLNPKVFQAIGIYNGKRRLVIGDTYNIVGRLPGTSNSKAIMLVAHYDSVYRAPGAADDGSAVAAILESVRALKARPALKNDLIVLFTDGEEAGLLGADAFSTHPWTKDVGLIMNFEARGNAGPSLLFETSLNNDMLIKTVAGSASHPMGSSLFYALYKLLPNDTDFSILRRYGIPGLNFAFGENMDAYHSPLDSVANLSVASLQHHGLYVLNLAQQFGQMELSRSTTNKGDDVFFDWFGDHMVAYSESWVIPGEILASALLILAMLLAVRRRNLGVTKILLALVYSMMCLLVVATVVAATAWLISHMLGRNQISTDSRANSLLLIGFILLGVVIGSLLVVIGRRYFTYSELTLGGLTMAWALNLTVALVLPAGSYLLFWPVLLMSLGAVLTGLVSIGRAWIRGVIGLIGTAAVILLFAPLVYLLYIFLTLNLTTILMVGLIIGLSFALCGSFVETAIPPVGWQPGVLIILVTAAVFLVTGIALSHRSPMHPRRDSVVYSMNADEHSASWISYDQTLDAWNGQFFSNGMPSRQGMPDYLGGLSRPVLSVPAPLFSMAPPIAEIETDDDSGDVRRIRMKIKSARGATLILLTFGKQANPVSVNIAGRNVVLAQDSELRPISLLGFGAEGTDLEVTFKRPSRISFWLMDQSYGLPTEPTPRPNDLIAADGSDLTFVCRKYSR